MSSPEGTAATVAAIAVPTIAVLFLTGRLSSSSKRGLAQRRAKSKLSYSSTPLSDDAVALDHLLAAFGPDGRNANGTAPGCMVASPSKKGDGDSNNYW